MPGLDCCFSQDALDEEAEAQGVTSLKQLTGSSKNACLVDITSYIVLLLLLRVFFF